MRVRRASLSQQSRQLENSKRLPHRKSFQNEMTAAPTETRKKNDQKNEYQDAVRSEL